MTPRQPPFPRVRSLIYGSTLPFAAGRLILTRPILLFWSAVPVLITLAVYLFILRSLHGFAVGYLQGIFQTWGLDPLGWVASTVLFLSKILLMLIGALTFSFVSALAASPFNDFLAEKTEALAHPPLSPTRRLHFFAKFRLIGLDLAKSLAAMSGTLLALLLSWIPGLNVAAIDLTFLLVCLQYISYPQTRRGQSLKEGLHFLWRHLFACSGFGASISFLFAIPVVSILALPLAVVGGTLLVARAPGNQYLPPLK